MRQIAFVYALAAWVAVLIIWGISRNSFHVMENISSLATTQPKCSRSIDCPADHFSLYIRSGSANVIGPKICFAGKTIMSHVLNNVNHGLNIVVLDGEDGSVEQIFFTSKTAELLVFVKALRPGMILLVASFDDVKAQLTDEVRELFVGMGSTLINSVNHRDGWVFAGSTGTEMKSVFEKQAVSDAKTDIYDGWPGRVEVEGCFPRITANVKKPS